MTKIPRAARLFAISLMLFAPAVYAAENSTPNPGGPSPFQFGECEAALMQIPLIVRQTSELYPWTKQDTAEIQDVQIAPTLDSASKVTARFAGQNYEIPTRTRLDALLLEHRAIFSPARAQVEVDGMAPSQAVTVIEKHDLTGFKDTTELETVPVIILGPMKAASQNSVAEISVLSSELNPTRERLQLKVRTGPNRYQQVRLVSQVDSLIWLLAQKLDLPHALTQLLNGEYVARTYFISDQPSSLPLRSKLTLNATQIKGLQWSRNLVGPQRLKIQFVNPTIPHKENGEKDYVTIETESEKEAILVLEQLINYSQVKLGIKNSRNSDRAGFLNTFTVQSELYE